jgi:hypothetical protein
LLRWFSVPHWHSFKSELWLHLFRKIFNTTSLSLVFVFSNRSETARLSFMPKPRLPAPRSILPSRPSCSHVFHHLANIHLAKSGDDQTNKIEGRSGHAAPFLHGVEIYNTPTETGMRAVNGNTDSFGVFWHSSSMLVAYDWQAIAGARPLCI